MRRGLTDFLDTGANLARPGLLALLAEAYGKVGRAEEGLQTVAKALEGTDETGAHIYDANLYRLKGELTLQLETRGWRLETGRKTSQQSKGKSQKSKIPNIQYLAPSTQVEACFLNAIEIAQHQQAKSWELRASTSLARLWRQQGKKKEARQILAEVYGWFTEGFDTKDLQEAKMLIEELSH